VVRWRGKSGLPVAPGKPVQLRFELSASDLYSVVPELSKIAIIDTEILFSLYSENITTKHWSEIAKSITGHIEKGADGLEETTG